MKFTQKCCGRYAKEQKIVNIYVCLWFHEKYISFFGGAFNAFDIRDSFA